MNGRCTKPFTLGYLRVNGISTEALPIRHQGGLWLVADFRSRRGHHRYALRLLAPGALTIIGRLYACRVLYERTGFRFDPG